MGVVMEFENFEKQFLELLQELQNVSSSERHLREALRVEATRAEAAEAGRDAALRAEAEARGSAAAAAAALTQATATLAKVQDELSATKMNLRAKAEARGSAAAAALTQATASLAKVQDELSATKMQFELAERHRIVLEEKYSENLMKMEELQRELLKLRPLQAAQKNLQCQFTELQERVKKATEEAGREASRLEGELRRVEKCANGGAEIRERARLAAAAHVRERRLAAAELQHTTRDLHNAKAEALKLGALVSELQHRLSEIPSQKIKCIDPNEEALMETRALLEVERAATARLEQALANALADNAALAAHLHKNDNDNSSAPTSPRPQVEVSTDISTNIGLIDSFLAE